MSEFIKTSLGIKHDFNTLSNRHFLNGRQSVYHCHHYTTLYTQLAIDANETDLLSEVAENNFYSMLHDYFTDNNITETKDKIEISCQYYSAMGLGTISVKGAGPFSAVTLSDNSHIEKGWIAKWGEFDKPVNYIGCGYISAMLSAIFDKPTGSYKTVELESIVKGAETTIFKSFIK